MSRTVTQGVFSSTLGPNTETASAIGELVSTVGVPQHAEDLANYEYQLVLHSIKQDLSAVLQRQVSTSVDVDWQLLMHPGAPEEPKHILQGLVYVAKIKDVANTRGGAQVSQHRRVLAQQTYNMLVQELSDVLQRQEVQRTLRDLSAGANLELSNQLSQVLNSLSSTSQHVIKDDDTDKSVKSSSTIHSTVDEMLLELESMANNEPAFEKITNIADNIKDEITKALIDLEQLLSKITDTEPQTNVHSSIELLKDIQQTTIDQMDYYETSVQNVKERAFSLKTNLSGLKGYKSQSKPWDDLIFKKLDSEIGKVIREYEIVTNQTMTHLVELNQYKENEMKRVQRMLTPDTKKEK